jgi:hypothetical protein
MSKRIELTNNYAACLTWYRSTRIRRAKSLQGCPKENLSPENQQRKAPQHLNMLEIVIFHAFFNNVITDDNRHIVTDQSSI